MTIQYSAPLSRAIERMRSVLFQPFNIRLWFVLGFTAFLDGLLSGGGSGPSSRKNSHFNLEEVLGAPYQAREWLLDHPHWLALAIAIGLLIVIILAVLLWISSRGKFMFLDNVVQRRALVRQPWQEFREQAQSLFWWRTILIAIGIGLIAGTLYHVWQLAYQHYNEYDEILSLLPSLIGWGVFFLLSILGLSYFGLILDHFLVPLMYKNRSTAAQAWDRFSELHGRHFGSFILYGLFILLIMMVVGIIVILVGLFTCCMGFVLVAIPYINAVVLLPVSYTIRTLSMEFLAQFGEDYKVLSD